MDPMIFVHLVIWIVLAAIGLYILNLALTLLFTQMQLPAGGKNIVLALIAFLVLIWILSAVGLLSSPFHPVVVR